MAPKTRRQAQAARTRSIAKKRAQPLKPAPERQPRTRDSRRRQLIDAAQRRKPAVNSYRFLQQPMERQAAQHAAENFPTRLSSPRRWDQLTRERGYRALRDESRRPHTINFQLSLEVNLLVVVICTLRFWVEPRISAELKRRAIATIAPTSVKRIFHPYHWPTNTSHPKGQSDGIKRRRYRRPVANEWWRLDFKDPIAVLKGRKVWIVVVIDDFSRCCLGLHVCFSACADTVKTALQAAFDRYGKPREMLTDNATAVTAVWQLDTDLARVGVEHKISADYPQSNGTAEAFIPMVSAEGLQMKECAKQPALEAFAARFRTYYKPYRAHGSLGYQPPVWWYTGTCPRVKGRGGLCGLETVAQQWSGESSAEAPIVVTTAELACCKALVPIA